MYSLISSWISESSSPNRNSASVLDSSVLPTPEGPAKMNDPPGRFGSLRPARVRLIACDSDLMASFCPITRRCSSSSMRSSRWDSSSVSLKTGMPVAVASTSAISSSFTSATASMSPAFHSFSLVSFFSISCFSVSRSAAAFSKSWESMADSFSRRTSAIFSSNSRRSGGPVLRQLRRRGQRVIGDRHAVVRLVAVAQALEDLDGVRDRRLGHLDRLEPALQRGVLLEVLAVLVQRGRADGLQLAAGQHRLQYRRGVDRALRRAGADQRVDLVDEQDDVAAGADLLQDLLQPLLEVTAVPGTRDQRAKVQRVELLVLDGLRHLALDDLLGQPLDDRGLAHAGLADQHRVVLGAAGEHLHHALDFLLPADHRVELALSGRGGQVAAKLVKNERGGRRGLRRRAGRGGLLALVAVQQLDHLLPDPVQVGAQPDEHLGGHALALADQPEQDVLGADVVVAELQRLAQRQLQDLLGPGSERDVSRRCLLPLADDLLDLLPYRLEADPQ